jgi:hypothetical protein
MSKAAMIADLETRPIALPPNISRIVLHVFFRLILSVSISRHAMVFSI